LTLCASSYQYSRISVRFSILMNFLLPVSIGKSICRSKSSKQHNPDTMTSYAGLCSDLCGLPDPVPTLLRLLVSIKIARCLRIACAEPHKLHFWYLWVAIRLLVEALARCEERRSAPDSAFDRFHMLLIFAAWWYDEIVECAKLSTVEMWKATLALDGACTAGTRNMHSSKEGIYIIYNNESSLTN
jgi:hypothetical protein